MSRYMVNKLIRHIEMSDAEVAAYRADTTGYVDGWLAWSAGPHERPDEHELTAEERQAFIDRDEGELYRLGAHPYLLWHFIEAVWIEEVPSWRDLVERYRANIVPHGTPDFIC